MMKTKLEVRRGNDTTGEVHVVDLITRSTGGTFSFTQAPTQLDLLLLFY